MTQPLRTTHRVVFWFLPIVLAAVLVGGLDLRYRWPASHKLPTNAGTTSEASMTVAGLNLRVRWLGQTVLTERKLQLITAKPLAAPDLLLYWSAESAAKAPPPNALFLGSYRVEGIYTAPADARSSGYLSLYSLGHRQVVASIPLGSQP